MPTKLQKMEVKRSQTGRSSSNYDTNASQRNDINLTFALAARFLALNSDSDDTDPPPMILDQTQEHIA